MQLQINKVNEPLISVTPTDTKFLQVTDKQGNILGAITVGDLKQQLTILNIIPIDGTKNTLQ